MSNGRIEAIWVKRAHGGPMDSCSAVHLHADRGVDASADQGGKRQVTIIEKERWQDMMAELSADLDPSARRANLMVSGVALAHTRGQVLQVGACRLRVLGETRPCKLMEETLPGLQEAMTSEWRGGIFAEVLQDSEIRVGDAVEWESTE